MVYLIDPTSSRLFVVYGFRPPKIFGLLLRTMLLLKLIKFLSFLATFKQFLHQEYTVN